MLCGMRVSHAQTDLSGIRERLEPFLIRAKEGKYNEQMTRFIHAQFDYQRKYAVENQMAKLVRTVHIEQNARPALYQ